MSRNGLVKIGLGVLLLAAITFLILALRRPAEPTYQGHSLIWWLSQYRSNVSHLPMSAQAEAAARQAEKAIRTMGTNSLPTLILLLHAHDSSLKKLVMRWSTRQSLIKFDFTPDTVRWWQAQAGYRLLGPAAKGQVSELTRMLTNGSPPGVRANVAGSLGSIGLEAKSAASALLVAATDQDANVRNSSFWALWQIGGDAQIVVPGLIKGLDDPYELARENAAIALGRYGRLATSAVPALVRAVATNRAAFYSLSQIDPETAKAAKTH